MEKEIITAMLGLSKLGKTSFINSLSHDPKELLSLHTANNARTKITVNYRFVPYEKEAEDRKACLSLTLNRELVTCDVSREDEICAFWGIEKEEKDTALFNRISQSVQNLSIEAAARVINKEGAEKYITGVTIVVPACEELSRLLRERNMVLTMRDTRGMLDMVVDKEAGGKMSVAVPSLSGLGLDGIDAVLFMGAETMQDSVAELYREMLETVMKAVPVFILYRDCHVGDKEVTGVEEAKKSVEELRKKPDYLYIRLYEMMVFLENLEIVERDSEKNKFRYKSFGIFDMEDTEYAVPECEYLLRKKAGLEVPENPMEDSGYVSYSAFARFTVLDMTEKLLDYYEKLLSILQGKELINELRSHREEFGEIVLKDFQNYTCGKGSKTRYVRPCVEYECFNSISRYLADKNAEILGERGGITTLFGGGDNRMRYAATAISAVALRSAFRFWLLQKDFYGKLPSELKLTEKEKTQITNKALSYILYKQFTDTDATIHQYLFVDRWIMKANIKELREKQKQEEIVCGLAKKVYDVFCDGLSDLQSADVWKLIKYDR